jgi:hypothetical protein
VGSLVEVRGRQGIAAAVRHVFIHHARGVLRLGGTELLDLKESLLSLEQWPAWGPKGHLALSTPFLQNTHPLGSFLVLSFPDLGSDGTERPLTWTLEGGVD